MLEQQWTSQAHQDQRRLRHCTRKHAWQSRMVATNVATALAWAGKPGNKPYKCDYGDHWHVGHPQGPTDV